MGGLGWGGFCRHHLPTYLIFTYVILVVRVRPVHHLQKLHFNLGLVEEWLLIFYDLDSSPSLLFMVICLHHLQEITRLSKVQEDTKKKFDGNVTV